MSGLAMIWWSAWTGALAGIPVDALVLHAGEPDLPVERVAATTGRPQWELAPLHLSDLDDLPGLLQLEAATGPCPPDAVTNESLRAATELAQGKMLRRDYAAARTLLQETAQTVRCLTQSAEASALAELFLELGIACALQGQAAEATEAYRRALAFDPSVGWDYDHDPSLAGGLEAARTELEQAPRLPVGLGPGLEVSQLWVDGRFQPVNDAKLALPAGVHLVQTLQPVSTLEISLSEDQPLPVLVDGHALQDDLVTRIGEPQIQAALAALLGPRQVYLWSGSEVWALVEGSWQLLPAAPSPAGTRSPSSWRSGLRSAGLWSVLAGGVVAGAGAFFVATNPAVVLTDKNGPQMARRYGGLGLLEGGAAVAGSGVVAIGLSFVPGQRTRGKEPAESP